MIEMNALERHSKPVRDNMAHLFNVYRVINSLCIYYSFFEYTSSWIAELVYSSAQDEKINWI